MINKKVRKAIFPVAGLGTRFLPATKVIPKEMLPVLNKPVIQYALEEAQRAGIEEFIFVTGRGKNTIEDHFDISYELEQRLIKNNKHDYNQMIKEGMPEPGKIFYTRQQIPMGLGHAVYCARSFIKNEPFAVILPDEFFVEEEGNKSFLKSMIECYEESSEENIVIAAKEIPKEKVSSYGIFDIEKIENNIIKAKNIVEKPKINEAPSNYAIIGRYILPYEIFDVLKENTIGVGGEVQLTDAIATLVKKHNSKIVGNIFTGIRHDCGNPLGLLEASIERGINSKDISVKNSVKELIKKYLEA